MNVGGGYFGKHTACASESAIKTLLKLKDKEEIIARLQAVRPNSPRRWGGMAARQHSGENFGQGQLDTVHCVGDLAAYSQSLLLDASIMVEDQHLQGVADVVVALGHYPEADKC